MGSQSQTFTCWQRARTNLFAGDGIHVRSATSDLLSNRWPREKKIVLMPFQIYINLPIHLSSTYQLTNTPFINLSTYHHTSLPLLQLTWLRRFRDLEDHFFKKVIPVYLGNSKSNMVFCDVGKWKTIKRGSLSNISVKKMIWLMSIRWKFVLHPWPRAGGLNADAMPFTDHLLASLGRGATSCVEIQESAMAMVRESNGNCSAVTKAISRIGCSGKFPGNCERDLFRVLTLPVETRLHVFFLCEGTHIFPMGWK